MDNYLKFSKKDAESWLEFVYPLTIIKDRYSGAYSGGVYVAYPCEFYDVDEAVAGNDVECMAFWGEFCGVVGLGNSYSEAFSDLVVKMKNILER